MERRWRSWNHRGELSPSPLDICYLVRRCPFKTRSYRPLEARTAHLMHWLSALYAITYTATKSHFNNPLAINIFFIYFRTEFILYYIRAITDTIWSLFRITVVPVYTCLLLAGHGVALFSFMESIFPGVLVGSGQKARECGWWYTEGLKYEDIWDR